MSNNTEVADVPPSPAAVAGALSTLHPPVAAAASPELSLETLTVDVICPSRLGHGHSQGFAVAPFPIRVPSAALESLDGVFAALKLGALADESEVRMCYEYPTAKGGAGACVVRSVSYP